MTTQRILLTGASGFIATHILQQLLADGAFVRCTVRTDKKKQEILAAHPKSAAQLDFAIVEDIALAGAFDAAVQATPPLDAIIHTASPYHFNSKDMLKDMLEPAVQGTKSVLQAAKQFAPSVKRVVITSSFAAIIDQSKGKWPGKIYTGDDWNPITWEAAQEDAGKAYFGSKTFADRAAWKFVEEEKPHFDVVVLCPPMVFGPFINKQSLDSLNTSNAAIWKLLSGQTKEIPPTAVHLWVDVRDLARAHVRAVSTLAAGGQRFLIAADGTYSNQEMADVLRARFPAKRAGIPEGKPGSGLGIAPGEFFVADNSKSKRVLGMTYGSFEDMLVAFGETCLAQEQEENQRDA